MTGLDIAVTGLGLVTPGGVGVEAGWAAVRAGRSTAARDPLLAGHEVTISCRVPDFDADALLGARRAVRLDRFTRLALVAAREAVAGEDLATWDSARVGVVIGTSAGGGETFERQHGVLLADGPTGVSPLVLPMHLPNMVAGQVAIEFGFRGPNLVVSTACASGATAIGVACDLLAARRCDVVLAGGVDALLNPLTMAGFARMGALSRRDDPATASRPFDVDRDGFVAGEGAAVLVLRRAEDARADGRRVRARVVGYGATADAHHITNPDPEGRGVAAATRAALADAGASASDVDHVNAHGTSTQLNDLVEGRVLAELLPSGPLVTSTKGVTGHLLGAAGAAEAVFTVLAVEQGVVPPTANLTTLDPRLDLDVATAVVPRGIDLALSNSFGFGGQNAVLAIAKA
ncbi:beta-ketoacyl-[acyl-carrier-protein] synthase family protein [Saccharothrix sp. 6-C]|uniref:beta-ketoacyl-[acyl-carrier-protein] synthase family protein n=1 Tax=Saccharothrix sp. 6-C TaxID=2781735 RepID=UPI001916F44B|nr:beta-ketoacyl-[acyl-carrier-protein] synthase family protein [Saccharothrix sp. 6-C]QQQ74607.1 beta-ketoacyl-[acyl-carrier-protein] synthase family protein [Saccharothrix sp. 6-C]